jgi:acyl carrier protein
MSEQNAEITGRNVGTIAKVAAIWKDVLMNDACRENDDFLNCGGDSLAAMLCIARINQEFGVELELEDFFVEPATISHIASLIEVSRQS